MYPRRIVAVLFLAIASVGAIHPGHVCIGSGAASEESLHQVSYVSTASSRRIAGRAIVAPVRQPTERRWLWAASNYIPQISLARHIFQTPVSQHQILTI
jgi:hypothetical protein